MNCRRQVPQRVHALEAAAFARRHEPSLPGLIGTWLVVIATSDGAVVGRLTLMPDARINGLTTAETIDWILLD